MDLDVLAGASQLSDGLWQLDGKMRQPAVQIRPQNNGFGGNMRREFLDGLL